MDVEKQKKPLPKWLYFLVAIILLIIAGLSLNAITDRSQFTKQVKKLESELNEKKKELDRLKNEYEGAKKVKLNTDAISREAEKHIKEIVLKLEEKNKEIETFKIKTQKAEKQVHDLKINIKDLEQKIIAVKKKSKLDIKKRNEKLVELKDKCKKKITELKDKRKKMEKAMGNYNNELAIILTSPVNGRQGARAGEPIIVKGTMNDKTIKAAQLLLNNAPIPIKVYLGRFRKKIFLPNTKVITFRVIAFGSNGIISYSSLHTVSIGEKIDIQNPTLF
jgi:hypothetical protein